MKKKLFLRLCLMMSAILALSSCIHDEVYSSSDPSSTEYTNKTLWKQDEKYIKNVMAVYLENEKEIRKSNGVPFWDYATTINRFDESFLMVPVVENKRVVSVLQVPRKGNNIHFHYSRVGEQISFFQGLIFAKHKKEVFSENDSTARSIICTTQIFAVWLPDDESNPDPESGAGTWGTQSIVVCRELLEDCVGIIDEFGQCSGGGGDPPGFPYPGEGAEPPKLPNPKDPCAKMKAQATNTKYTNKITYLEGKVYDSEEFGFRVGNHNDAGYEEVFPTSKSSQINFEILNNTFGYMHTHYEGLILMFSPGDINTFIKLLKNAQNNGIPLSMVFMTLVNPDGTIYQLRGDNIDIANLSVYPTNIIENIVNNTYKNDYEMGKANQSPEYYQTQFLKFMRDLMPINGAKLYSVDGDGKAKEIYLQGNNRKTSDCPK